MFRLLLFCFYESCRRCSLFLSSLFPKTRERERERGDKKRHRRKLRVITRRYSDSSDLDPLLPLPPLLFFRFHLFTRATARRRLSLVDWDSSWITFLFFLHPLSRVSLYVNVTRDCLISSYIAIIGLIVLTEQMYNKILFFFNLWTSGEHIWERSDSTRFTFNWNVM